MAGISLCMIVKDEEAVLERCLQSVGGAVDEIVVVDTGSTDKTKEIAARYTDKVYDFPWVDDFSAARNFSFSKATQENILWLDADDILLPRDLEMLIALKEHMPDVDMVYMRYHSAFNENGIPLFSYFRERLLRREAAFQWKGRVHEAIAPRGRILYSDIAITHRSAKAIYPDRNLRIYEKQLAEGAPFSPRDTFYYGRELYYHKHYAKAEAVLDGFLRSGEGWLENNIEACKVLASCRREQGDLPGAADALCRSFRWGAPRAEICCALGAIHMEQSDWQAAAFWYEAALHAPRNDASGAFIVEDCYGFLPCIQLAVCYDRLGEYERAEQYNLRAGAYRPSSPAYIKNLEYFARRRTSLHP